MSAETEIKKPEVTGSSLRDRIKLATQHKEPSKINTPSFKPNDETVKEELVNEPEKKAVDNTPKKSSASWNSDDDFETKPTAKKETTEEAENRPPTEQEMRGGARSIVGAYNMTQRGIYTFLSQKKLKGSFTPEQLELINTIDFKPKAVLKEDEKILLGTWEKLLNKHTKITKEIPLSPTEAKDMEEAAYLYQESTGKALPPWLFAVLALINSNAKRVMDIYLD